MKNTTAGPGWFDLPAPPESELPRLYREVEALRLHKQLDPKQFYRKEPGEGKGIKGLPKHFAVRLSLSLPSSPPSPYLFPYLSLSPSLYRFTCVTQSCTDVLPTRRLARSSQQTRPSAEGARTTCPARTASARSSTSSSTTPRRRATPRRSSGSSRPSGARGAGARSPRRRRCANPSGSTIRVLHCSRLPTSLRCRTLQCECMRVTRRWDFLPVRVLRAVALS